MDKELPARIWVPVLIAAALVPVAIFAPLIMKAIILFGGIGAGCYFAFRVPIAGRKWRALGCVLGGLFAASLVANLVYPLTPEQLAAQAQMAAQAQAQPHRSAYTDQGDRCNKSAAQREAYLELKQRLADGTLTISEREAANEATGNFEIDMRTCF
jgi:hypothetical protein